MRVLRLAGAVAAAFLIGSCPGSLMLVGTQGSSGQESVIGVLAGFVIIWAVSYGLGGMVAVAVMETPRPVYVAAGACSAIGGGASGLLIAGLLLTHNLGGSAEAVYLDFGIALLLPWIIGRIVWKTTRTSRGAGEVAQ